MTDYNAAAKLLDELMLELIEKGASIPARVIGDLRACRSLTSIGLRQTDDTGGGCHCDNHGDSGSHVHSHGDSVEAKAYAAFENAMINLLSLAEAADGAKYANEWQLRIDGAYQPSTPPPTAAALGRSSTFVSRVPKGQHWVRIDPAEFGTAAELEALLNGAVLSASAQGDGYLLIHGEKETILAFLKEIREKKAGDQS